MPDLSAKVQEALALASAGQVQRAASMLRRAVRLSPQDPDANASLAEVLALDGDLRGAAFYAQRAAERPGAGARHWTVLGHALCLDGRYAEGAEWLRRSVEAEPGQGTRRELLVRALLLLERFEEVEACCRAGLAVETGRPVLYQALAQALTSLAKPDEALGALDEGLAKWPGEVNLACARANALLYRDDVSEAQVLEAHRAFGESLSRAVAARPSVEAGPRGEGPVRVGFMSPDFREHSVSYFMEPLLRSMDRSRVHVTCYYTCPKADSVTARFRGLSDRWREAAADTPAALAQRVRADRIDLLVDLCGAMTGHRLEVMALRPARVQATYLGYPATTGVPAIDVRIVDWTTDPAGSERFGVERLERLDPCFLCYGPHPEAPPPTAQRDPGNVRFGSFNMLQKISPECARSWAEVLSAVPGSTLVLKPGWAAHGAARATLLRRLSEAGIDPRRVEFLDRTPDVPSHLGHYARVDIALDTFPYHGTTTTCEALLMGVPVVTRMGQGHRSRVGGSILRAVGLGDLIAGTRDEFVTTAAALAAHAARLAEHRASLRSRVLNSPLCDADGAALRFAELATRLTRQ